MLILFHKCKLYFPFYCIRLLNTFLYISLLTTDKALYEICYLDYRKAPFSDIINNDIIC